MPHIFYHIHAKVYLLFSIKNHIAYVIYKSLPDSIHIKSDSLVNMLKTYTLDLCGYIEDLKVQIVMMSEVTNEQTAEQMTENPGMIMSKDSREIVRYFIYYLLEVLCEH